MPWTYPDNVPAVAENWSAEEQRRCVEAANAALEETGDEEQAIFACIRAAGKARDYTRWQFGVPNCGAGEDERKGTCKAPNAGASHGERGEMKHKAFPFHGFKALEDEGEGVFEAIVAVFGNVDRVGEKIIPGAFTKSLEGWVERDRAIPVIFSHNWDDLDAHIGQVLEAEERDEGLYVKGRLDIGEEFARKVWRKMDQGLIADFSFAYDEVKEAWVDDVHELRELDILEVGPTLVGVNPATHLISVKELGEKEVTTVQAMHDLAINLGAKCSGTDGDGADGGGQEGDDKSITSRTQASGDDGAGGDNGDDEGQGGGGDVTPRTSRRSLLAAREMFGPLVHKAS